MSSDTLEDSGVFVFENEIPKAFSTDHNSEINISPKHFKVGKHSLKWSYTNNSYLQINSSIGYKPFDKEKGNQKIDTFSLWIYNENPIVDKLTFEFGREGKKDCSFTFRLNFCGWRTVWVSFERDMEGVPHPDMNYLLIKASKQQKRGELYFDQIILSSEVDPRYHIRDFQVPFVNEGLDKKPNNHWMSLYRFYNLKQNKLLSTECALQEKSELTLIKERFEKNKLSGMKGMNPNESKIDEIKMHFDKYEVVRHGNNITGRSVDYAHYKDIYPVNKKKFLISITNGINVKEYTEFMREVAMLFRTTTDNVVKERLSSIFIDLVDHLRDQGWMAGSGLGTLHHLGYNLKGYYVSLFLMRDELSKYGKLKEIHKDMYWFSGAGRIFVSASENSGGIIDIFNTTLEGMLSTYLMDENESNQRDYLYQLSNWISQFLRNAPGLMSCFKIDGSAFHHAGHYPAYAIGGFEGVAPVIYYLSGTSFHIAEDAHNNVKNALLTMRLYSNKYEWLLSLAGRHPTGKGALSIVPYKYLALAGPPDGTKIIDENVAAAYLRLNPEDHTSFKNIMAEEDPNGHWTLNYAALSVHRRKNWLIGARGHSRYLWGNESYLNANLYGRYITYGHVQILGSGNPVNNHDSGFYHDGWDWNRWPGTTIIHLPFDKLKSDIRNVDKYSGFEEMLLSDETYAGGVNLEGENGMFAMKLHEHPKYNGSHKARKSVFFFEDHVILLGSDIENNDSEHHTETVLFQNHLEETKEKIWIGKEGAIISFPCDYSKDLIHSEWIVDNKNNGYYIPSGQSLNVIRQNQESRSQKTGEITTGNFVTSWIDHGRKPSAEKYEYAIKIQTTVQDMEQFAEKMNHPETELYSVLRKDNKAHIVKDQRTGIKGYALFEENNQLNQGVIQGNSLPCMIMTRINNEKEMKLSVVNPDLKLYKGIDEHQYDENGRRKEVSIYSRDWLGNESQPTKLRITLLGKWNLSKEMDDSYIIPNGHDQTTIVEFILSDGQPIETVLYFMKQETV